MAVEGFVEHVSNVRVAGWAKGPEGGEALVEVLVDGVSIVTVPAQTFRPDVGPHGFDVQFAKPLAVDTPVTVSVVGGGILCTRTAQAWVPSKPVAYRLRVPLYASPFRDEIAAAEGWSAERLTMSRTFADTGLLRIRLDRPDFDALARRITAVDYHGEPRVQDAWRTSEDVRALACDPTVLGVLQQLYGREAIPMQTLNFRVGTEQSTHTDTVHFNSQPANFMCGVWVALEAIRADNGPLHYYPGSHNLPIIDLDDIGALADDALWAANYEYHQEVLRELVRVKALKKATVLAEPGHAIIWAANLLHGGEPITRAGSTRHSQVTHYYFSGCSYYTPSRSNVHLGRYRRETRHDIRSGEPLKHFFEELPLPFGPTP